MKEDLVKQRDVMQGSVAVGEAIKSAEPGVIAAFPITPQTHIVEYLAKLVNNGELNSKYINVDSEFSAASTVFGSSAAGVRSYTASASQGLMLMTEVIFNMAGTRLPVVFTAVNRSLAPPINIQVDHQDSMTMRDSGMIQLYVENVQEAVDTHIQMFKIAEDKDVLLPAMVCMDGWIVSHVYEPVTLWRDEAVREFLPPFDPVYKVDPKAPLTYGALSDDDKITEFQYMVNQALEASKDKIKAVSQEFGEMFGNDYGGLIESYRTEDADMIIVAMGSMVGTIRVAVDQMRDEGQKVGLVKVRSYRPFPGEELEEALKNARTAVVLDRSFSASAGGMLGNEIKSFMHSRNRDLEIANYIIGLGGREVYPHTVKSVVEKAKDQVSRGEVPRQAEFFNLN